MPITLEAVKFMHINWRHNCLADTAFDTVIEWMEAAKSIVLFFGMLVSAPNVTNGNGRCWNDIACGIHRKYGNGRVVGCVLLAAKNQIIGRR